MHAHLCEGGHGGQIVIPCAHDLGQLGLAAVLQGPAEGHELWLEGSRGGPARNPQHVPQLMGQSIHQLHAQAPVHGAAHRLLCHLQPCSSHSSGHATYAIMCCLLVLGKR